MAKEKLFTPEDFDKPKDKKFWQKYRMAILWIACILIIAGILLCWIFCGRNKTKEMTVEKESTEQIASAFEAQISYEDTKTDKTEATKKILDNEQEDDKTSPESTIRPPKEKNTENLSTIHVVHQSDGSNDVEAQAMKVIHGDYGNGEERKEKLGSRYQTIQSRVNELKREGIF